MANQNGQSGLVASELVVDQKISDLLPDNQLQLRNAEEGSIGDGEPLDKDKKRSKLKDLLRTQLKAEVENHQFWDERFTLFSEILVATALVSSCLATINSALDWSKAFITIMASVPVLSLSLSSAFKFDKRAIAHETSWRLKQGLLYDLDYCGADLVKVSEELKKINLKQIYDFEFAEFVAQSGKNKG